MDLVSWSHRLPRYEQYFKANYADSQYVDALQQTTTYSPNPAGPFKFGLDNFRSRRFFNEISIYQLSRQKFKQFELSDLGVVKIVNVTKKEIYYVNT